ncbi:MAG: CDP-diacylglycerol--serine O-phosphatidyltransferase [Alphaproteobacteria bacterium HGW-Alphaproteobacteria-6]|nr:MAG: CDP-diacylglycerol--serine O-phosphatidyltransferase [Alphaproteobacteria bacterium HGW-Alphaproteobacteria-6]
MAHPPPPPRPRDALPFVSILPNLVTMLGLCAGLTAIRFLMAGNFQLAVGLILFSTLIDGLDGLLARRLQATSDIGAQLDSLSDFLNFGVAPALLVYHFALEASPDSGGWIFVLVYVSCCCMRLARFNVAQTRIAEAGEKAPRHFTGVPAPAGALLALLPAFLSFSGLIDARSVPALGGPYLALVGLLMVSRLPTFSPKSLLIPRERIVWILIATAFAFGILLTRFWLSMVLIDLAYGLSLLHSLYRWLRRRQPGKP